MTWLDKLEKKMGWFAIPHLTLILVVGQAALYLFSNSEQFNPETIALIPGKVLAGEYFRLFTFIWMPPMTNMLFAFFYFYLFWLMGSALEHEWGEFRYTVFLFIAYFATVAVSFVTPDVPSSNMYFQGSVFLAFAYLFPDFELLLFFVLPVKIKWLALITLIGYALMLVLGPWQTKLLVLAALSNYLLFFGKDMLLTVRARHRRMKFDVKNRLEKQEPFHRCSVCGKTDQSNPELEFRYCPDCRGTHGYCPEHIQSHEHILEA